MPEQTVLLLGDTSQLCHWGCTGTSAALKAGITARGYGLDSASLENVPRAIGRRITRADDFDNEQLPVLLSDHAPSLYRQLEAADHVLVNGEGSLHGNRNVAKLLLYLIWFAATRLGKPVSLVNHSCYPHDATTVDDDEVLGIYQRAYRAVHFVAVREPVSHRLVTRHLRADARQSFDCLPLYISANGRAAARTRRKAITFASTVIWDKTYAATLVETMARLAAAGYGIDILVGANGELNHEDRAFMRDLGRAWRRQVWGRGQFLRRMPWRVVDAPTMEDWLAAIGNSRLLVSGRFHHTIAAACLGTPAVVLNSNTPKVEGTLEVLGGPPCLCYGEQGWERELWHRINEALTVPAPTAATVSALSKRLCDLAERNFLGLDREQTS